ncbi:MAG TPA: hypothetical protein VF940_11885 [Streptosporangiaceae bacterium]
MTANLRWLAGYRHPRHRAEPAAGLLRQVFTAGGPLMAGAGAAVVERIELGATFDWAPE